MYDLFYILFGPKIFMCLQHFLFLSPAELQTTTAPDDTETKSSSESEQPLAAKPLIKPEDLEPLEPGSSLKTPKILRQPRPVQDQFITSSSLIGAGSDGSSTSGNSIAEVCFAQDKCTYYHTVLRVCAVD